MLNKYFEYLYKLSKKSQNMLKILSRLENTNISVFNRNLSIYDYFSINSNKIDPIFNNSSVFHQFFLNNKKSTESLK